MVSHRPQSTALGSALQATSRSARASVASYNRQVWGTDGNWPLQGNDQASPRNYDKRDRRFFRNLTRFSGSLIFVVALGLDFGIPLLQAHNALRPPRFPVGSVSPADLDLDYIDITLSTEDNLTLYGWYIPLTIEQP